MSAAFIWRLRAAMLLRRRAALGLLQAWRVAGSLVEDQRAYVSAYEWQWDSPSDAVDEELSCWGS